MVEFAEVDWPEPRGTGNCHLLEGFIAARISGPEGFYSAVLGFPLIIEHCDTGNRYRVTVEQISGTE